MFRLVFFEYIEVQDLDSTLLKTTQYILQESLKTFIHLSIKFTNKATKYI